VKNITVAVPDEVYRAARVRAAEGGTSVSALVAGYLRSLVHGNDDFALLAARQRAIQAGIEQFSAAERLGRDEVHDRALR
jgi:plasmid stability protein